MSLPEPQVQPSGSTLPPPQALPTAKEIPDYYGILGVEKAASWNPKSAQKIIVDSGQVSRSLQKLLVFKI